MDHAEPRHYDGGLYGGIFDNIQVSYKRFYHLFFVRLPCVEFLLAEHDHSFQMYHKRRVADQEGLYSEGRAGPFRDCVRIGQFGSGADTVTDRGSDIGQGIERGNVFPRRAIYPCDHVHSRGGVDTRVDDGVLS